MSRDKRFNKLLRLSIQGNELEALLENLGFEKRQGKGSHIVWFKKGFEPIILARHGKEYKKGYLRQIIAVLRNGGMLNEETK
jgi:predicted RNA binding protein YcfA (HicA-like mRNA interferase family)